MDEQKLHYHLLKCELQYRADHMHGADQLDWLAPYCNSLSSIAGFLRTIGFRIREIVDDEDCSGVKLQWVITTSGVIVYLNTESCKGLFAKAAR